MSTRFPTFFIPHGGGPWPFMEWPKQFHAPMEHHAKWLRGFLDQFTERPRAILVVSAHWETSHLRVASNASPQLYYDYYGFPPQTYDLSFPAPGDPELASHVKQLLLDKGFQVELDAERGWDHGVFIPFMLMFPNADIPIVQLSLEQRLEPDYHLRVGQSLASLRDQGVLIIGSGMSFHNMSYPGGDYSLPSRRFDQWLTETVKSHPQERHSRLQHWEQAPSARDSHRREEHLIPLMVAAGAAASEPGEKVFEVDIISMLISGFRFGQLA